MEGQAGLSDKDKGGHHAFYATYSYRGSSLQMYLKLNMTGSLPTFFIQRLSAKQILNGFSIFHLSFKE